MKQFNIFIGPVAGIVAAALMLQFSGEIKIAQMVFVTVWMAFWWVSEIVPLAVTAMIPVFAFPMLGLMSTTSVASVYMNDVLFLFIGGFIISFAMEKWNLHQRIALHIILRIGTEGSHILLGLMLCSFLISMWISNTATTMMLMPTVLAIIHKIYELNFKNKENIAKALLLGIAHAATIGGVATVVGTPTNMIFVSYFDSNYTQQEPISFLKWFMFGFPVAISNMLIAYFNLKYFFLRNIDGKKVAVDKQIFLTELKVLGKMSFEEKTVASLFALLVVLWFTRADLIIGSNTLRGWSNLFVQPKFIQDGAVAVLVSMLLFLISAKKENTTLITWHDVKKLPYSVILLFGGGFALAKGFEESGLTQWLALQLNFLSNYPAIIIVMGVCIFITLVSEFASNMAAIQLCLPILAAIALSINIHPLLLMLPGTFAASYAFMMPVGTAPNTIVFGSEKLQTKDMLYPGIILNVAGVLIITLAMFTLGRWVFGI